MTQSQQTAPEKETKEENTNSSAPQETPKGGDFKKGSFSPTDQKERKPRRGGNRNKREKEVKEFEEAILQIDRVTRVVKGGRRLRFRVSVVIGDQKNRVGFGIGKSSEVMIGIQKAVAKAKKNLMTVPIFRGTIPHPQSGSFKASQVLLFPAPEGKGVIAGGAVRKILELAGVRDVLSKVHGSRNKLNVAYATLNALRMLTNQSPFTEEDIEEESETKNTKETSEKIPVKKEEKKADTKKNPSPENPKKEPVKKEEKVPAPEKKSPPSK